MEFQNLGITDVYIDIEGETEGNGALLGYTSDEYITISNCYSTGIVKGNNYSGGLAGYISSHSTVRNSYSTCDVSGDQYVGGLVGFCTDDLLFEDCFQTRGQCQCKEIQKNS